MMQYNVGALKHRIQAHEQYGSRDLNEWILEHMQVAEGFSILDLGCGTGKQTLPLAHRVGETGRVLAVDISQEALEAVSQSSKELGVEKRIDLLCTGMDDLGKYLPEQRFDRVLSAYALYYAQSPRTVLEVVYRSLKLAGMLFFCGPARDNNAEIKRFHYALRGEQPPVGSGWDVFMEEVGEPLAQQLFAQVETFTFLNPLRFDSAEALYMYWSSYGLYDETLDASFKAAAARHFQTYAVFETVKRVIGIKATR